MQAVDLNGDLNNYLFDKDRYIPSAHLNSICCLKQGEKTCRYICLTMDGYCCVKRTPMKLALDEQASHMNAKGDNCEGFGELVLKTNPNEKRL